MEEEIKKAWITGLRSGDYSQCRGKIVDGAGGHCCLAVLGKTVGFTIDIEAEQFVEDKKFPVYEDDGSPYPSLIKFGLTSELQFSFIDMNDDENMSFDQIANVIEKQL